MAVPNISDLTMFMGVPLTATDWLNNWTQVVNWLTDGTADLTVRSISFSGLFHLPQYTDLQVSGIVGMPA